MPVNVYGKYTYFELIHFRFGTNKKLVEMNIKTDSSCVYCNANMEILSYAFIECLSVKRLWIDVENWLNVSVDPYLKIGDLQTIFGFKLPDCFINRAILTTIQIIYKNRQTGKVFSLQNVKRKLSYQMQVEEFIALTNNKINHFNDIWDNVYMELMAL